MADGNSQLMPNMSFADGIWKNGSTLKAGRDDHHERRPRHRDGRVQGTADAGRDHRVGEVRPQVRQEAEVGSAMRARAQRRSLLPSANGDAAACGACARSSAALVGRHPRVRLPARRRAAAEGHAHADPARRGQRRDRRAGPRAAEDAAGALHARPADARDAGARSAGDAGPLRRLRGRRRRGARSRVRPARAAARREPRADVPRGRLRLPRPGRGRGRCRRARTRGGRRAAGPRRRGGGARRARAARPPPSPCSNGSIRRSAPATGRPS